MKKICFPATSQIHLARQKLLLDELKKYFEVDIFQPQKIEAQMSVAAVLYAVEFNNFLANKEYDAVLVRGDRYEVLGLAMVAAYKGIPLIHIEGGDLSGVIDNKVRHAITQLSDYHFCTNEESHKRLIEMGAQIDRIWNFGSLDVEFADKIEKKKIKLSPYMLVAFHPTDTDKEIEVDRAINHFDIEKVIIRSNKDYGRGYGAEYYSPEDYINLMRYASCCVGNSSSLLKEASILGVGVVNIGTREKNRLKPHNVLDVACDKNSIIRGIEYQMNKKYSKDTIYLRPNTSKKIAKKIKELI